MTKPKPSEDILKLIEKESGDRASVNLDEFLGIVIRAVAEKLDEQAERLERLESSQTKQDKPKSLTLEQIEGVIETTHKTWCDEGIKISSNSLVSRLKQTFREKLGG